MTGQYLVTLAAPPALEESIVDWLLQFGSQTGFTSQAVHGHSSREEGLSLAEQVAGRKRQVRFQLHIDAEEWPRFIEQLKRDFTGAGLHYWLVPVIESGHL
ncbi:MAG: hypothetical protein H6R26_1984 [Proteobacteria bacterium]|nr:hypothetical protein [Pseudomonadota bacterium]